MTTIYKEESGKGGVFGYIRRSVIEDHKAKPAETQMGLIRRYLETSSNFDLLERDNPSGRKVRAFYIDDGVSGGLAKDKRPALSKLIEDIIIYKKEEPKVKCHFIVYDTSRIARKKEVSDDIKKTFDELGVLVHDAKEGRPIIGQIEEIMFTFKLGFAEMERNSAISRARDHHEHTDWNPRKSYGWSFVKGEGAKEIPEEQEILKQIKHMFCNEGKTTSEIAKYMREKHGSRKRKTTEGENLNWESCDIKSIARINKWAWGCENTEDRKEIINSVISSYRDLDKNNPQTLVNISLLVKKPTSKVIKSTLPSFYHRKKKLTIDPNLPLRSNWNLRKEQFVNLVNIELLFSESKFFTEDERRKEIYFIVNSSEDFMKKYPNMMVDGVKLTKPTLLKYFYLEQPEDRKKIILKLKTACSKESNSMADLVLMLNEEEFLRKKKKGDEIVSISWPKQSAAKLVSEARFLIKQDKDKEEYARKICEWDKKLYDIFSHR